MDEPRNPDAYPEGIQFTDDAVRLLGENIGAQALQHHGLTVEAAVEAVRRRSTAL